MNQITESAKQVFEIGYSWKTRILENNNWLRLKYGFISV